MYILPTDINPEKVFIVNRSELEQRFDPKFIEPTRLNFYKWLKSGQEIRRLKDVIKEGSYGILPPGDTYSPQHEIKFIRATELKDDLNVDFENVNYVEDKYYTTRAAIKKNDILLAVKGATIASNKCVSFIDSDVEKSIVNGSIFRFQVNEKALPKYIAFLLDSDLLKKQMKFNLVANNAVDYLDKSLIYNLLIPLPELSIQESVVERLNAAYSRKKQKEAEAAQLLLNIDVYLLKQLGIDLPAIDNTLKNRMFTTKFSELSGTRLDPLFFNSHLKNFSSGIYDSVSIGSLALSLKSGFGVGRQDQAESADGIIQIRPTNIDAFGQLKFDRNVYVPEQLLKKVQPLVKGDVLFNNTNSQELVGKTALFNSSESMLYSNHITVINVDRTKILPEFLWLILNSYQKHGVFYSLCTNWNNQSGIGLELLKSINVPLPKLTKQKEIINDISQIFERANKIKTEAREIIINAKQQIENLIIGEYDSI